jgi:hypothetical protein
MILLAVDALLVIDQGPVRQLSLVTTRIEAWLPAFPLYTIWLRALQKSSTATQNDGLSLQT